MATEVPGEPYNLTISPFRAAAPCTGQALLLYPWPSHQVHHTSPRAAEEKMFSIMNEEAQRVVSSATLSRASSGSSSSTGEILGSIQQKLSSADQKMFGSNLYWEEENLEVSRVGSVCHDSSRGFLEPGSEVKSASSTLVDLARKLLLADQTMGLEVPLFDSSYPPPGNLNTSLLQARSTNHRSVSRISKV